MKPRFLLALAADVVAACFAPWLVPVIGGPGSIIAAVIGMVLMFAVWIAGGVTLLALPFRYARYARQILAVPLCLLLVLWSFGAGPQHKVEIAALIGAAAQCIAFFALWRRRER